MKRYVKIIKIYKDKEGREARGNVHMFHPKVEMRPKVQCRSERGWRVQFNWIDLI